MKPAVSILIPCYNAERWIAQAIESALSQSLENCEVIVYDDGSTDSSPAIIRSFGSAIRHERGSNRGGGAARNRLVEMGRADWLQFLDADDYLMPDKIENQYRMARHSGADLDDRARRFVSEDLGQHLPRRHVDDRQIGMTDPAMGDLDLDLAFAGIFDLDVVDQGQGSGVLFEQGCAHEDSFGSGFGIRPGAGRRALRSCRASPSSLPRR